MKSTVNLLPKKTPQELAAQKQRRLIVTIVAGTFGVLLISWAILFIYLQTLVFTENNLTLAVSKKEEEVRKLSETESLYKDVYNKTSAARVLLRNKEDYLNNLFNFEALLNPGLTLRDVVLDTTKVKSAILAPDIAAIIAYVNQLEDQAQIGEIFKKIVLTQVSIDKTAGYEVRAEGTFAHD